MGNINFDSIRHVFERLFSAADICNAAKCARVTAFSCTLLLLATARTHGQDQHFTQFYASPLSLNPALSGVFDGGYRLAMIYRDQGRNFLDEPYATYGVAADLRFKAGSYKKNSRDAFGTGVVFSSDRASAANFFTNQMAITGAYHKALSREGNHFLSAGFQMGVAQRNVNYNNLTFNDQFNGKDGYTDPTGEFFPENNFAFFDFGAGIHYAYAPYRKPGIFAGVSMFHINEPQVSFFANETLETVKDSDRLMRKVSAHISLILPLGNTLQFSPRALAYLQGPHLAANAGGNFRFLMNETKGAALHLGGWVRPVRNLDKNLGLDAAVLMLGLEHSNFLFGISYDANLSGLNTTGRRQGAIEFSLAFLGNYNNETILCPKF
ncbi:MAG: PorP/SprF family type IX secretion system membrane protein [Saprospiraceae bacterium]